ncbi:MAG: hypothetical protein Q9220_003811 [cf. Caloplaca sp. 1 TL-2023]
MGQYSFGTFSVTNSADLYLLRKDVHASYEDLKWAIVPKSSKWCFIYLDRAQELGALYHNREMYSLSDAASEYLLAGFMRRDGSARSEEIPLLSTTYPRNYFARYLEGGNGVGQIKEWKEQVANAAGEFTQRSKKLSIIFTLSFAQTVIKHPLIKWLEERKKELEQETAFSGMFDSGYMPTLTWLS